MRFLRHLVPATVVAGSLYAGPLAPSGLSQCEFEERDQILASDADTGDQYGAAVAVSGRIILSGASQETAGGAGAGALYVHDLSTGLEYKFTGFANDLLGSAVDVSLPYGAVGSPSPTKGGFVGLVERQPDGSWFWHTSWDPDTPGATPGDLHGADVALDGTRVAGGAPLYDGVFLDGGMVEIHEKVGPTWPYAQTLSPPDMAPGDQFGSRVAMRDGVLAVGSPFHEVGAIANAGAVYIYRHNGVSFVFEQKVVAPDPEDNAWLGLMLDTDGDRILAGAPGHDLGGAGSGNAYMFRYDGGVWVLEQNLKPADLAAGDNFGMTGQVVGEVAVIGAAFADPDGLNAAGAGYQFRHDGVRWIQQQKLVASDAEIAGRLGESAATDGVSVVLGSLLADTALADTGAVYRYDLPDLSLDVDPPAAVLGDIVSYTVCGGKDGNPVFLYVVAVNGVAFSQQLAKGMFGGGGSWTLSGKYNDPTLAGLTIDSLAFGLDGGGSVVLSNVATLELL